MIEQQIRSKLHSAFTYDVLDVTNESHRHSVPKDSETHFRVLLVTDEFESINRISRHRRVHAILKEELQGSVHALAIDAWTPAEWLAKDERPSLSPNCLGGSKADVHS